jgi:hypothetical protein
MADRQNVPAYLEDIARLAADFPPGGVYHVEVRHDSTCDLLNRRGPCNCRPDVELLRPV